MYRPDLRAAVVGAGFGGLAVAIRLQTMGIQTTIYERRDLPGGRAYVFRDRGFIFDAGPTVITAPHCLEELFSEAGRRLSDYVELLEVSPFYRLMWGDGTQIDYDGDPAGMEAQIRRLCPADLAGYRAFAAYAKEVFEQGYVELAARPFLRFADMVRVAPQLLRLRADRSVYATVSRFVSDERLRQALSFHSLLIGGNPFETSSIYTLIHHLEREWGVLFPRGGTGALVQALAGLFTELGGELLLCSPVRRIDTGAGNGRNRHRVYAGDRGGRDFDLVVSNADLHHTYADLLRGTPGAARRRRKLERMSWSMSLFVLYFGTDRLYRDRVAHHCVLFGPRYQGLLQEIFHGAVLPGDFSLYLHAPTVTDPGLAPPGCDTFYVLSPVPHLGNARVDWAARAPEYADAILERLERLLPDLRRHIVVSRWMTPVDFRDDLNAYLGSAFSCAPTLGQSAWFRTHNRDPEIPGLYIVGAGTHPGAGVPGVINSAKATARIIARDYGRSQVAS